MTQRPRGSTAEPVRNRCTCGHYPTSHLQVAPIPDPRTSASGGSFGLFLSGPCAICGESACRKFTPGP